MSTELTKLIPTVVKTGATWTTGVALLTVVRLREPALPRVHIPQQIIESKST